MMNIIVLVTLLCEDSIFPQEETPLSSPSKPEGSEEGHESSSRSSEAQRTLDFDSAKPIVTA